jgi:hypothetical protein
MWIDAARATDSTGFAGLTGFLSPGILRIV